MSQLEKLIKSIKDTSEKSSARRRETGGAQAVEEHESSQIEPQSGEQSQAIQLDFHQILKSFVLERKRMWQSILDYIEEIESEEAELEQILEQKKLDGRSAAEETLDVQFGDEEEDAGLNRTFTKVQIEIGAQYEHSMLFNSFQESNNTGLIESGGNTPIPKKLQRDKKKSERRRTHNLFRNSVQTLPTVLELENEP